MGEQMFTEKIEDNTMMQRYWDTFRRSEHFGPEKALLAAILEDAIKEYRTYCQAHDSLGQKRFREVEQWIMRERNDWIFSFQSVCEFLGLDPQYVRHELRREDQRQRGKPIRDEGIRKQAA
jgi:hypothetical protein